MRRGLLVSDGHSFVQIFRQAGIEFFALIGDNLKRDSVSTEPTREDSLCNHWCFFGRKRNQFHIFGEGIGHAENHLLVVAGGSERPEQVGMNALVGLSWLRKWCQQCGLRGAIFLAHLTLVATLQVIVYVGIHSRPEVTLEDALLGLVQAVMAGEQVTVSVLQDLIPEAFRQKDDDPAWFELSLDPSPQDVVFDEAVVGQHPNQSLTFGVPGNFTIH